MTLKNVLDFFASILSYVDLFGSPKEDFKAEFQKKYQTLGKIIREEAANSGQKVEKTTILGPRAKQEFEELKLWCWGQGINFNS